MNMVTRDGAMALAAASCVLATTSTGWQAQFYTRPPDLQLPLCTGKQQALLGRAMDATTGGKHCRRWIRTGYGIGLALWQELEGYVQVCTTLCPHTSSGHKVGTRNGTRARVHMGVKRQTGFTSGAVKWSRASHVCKDPSGVGSTNAYANAGMDIDTRLGTNAGIRYDNQVVLAKGKDQSIVVTPVFEV